ncbi:MAG TPA: protein kinase [Vicinamibacterales bacterium]|nr:protein kinase [Vicinamibacterales bacterium]
MVSDSSRSALVGRRLGVYQVQALLGVGGMGEVYRARDTRLGRDVALKVLPPQFTSDPDRLARLEREARALAALNYPNIATIYGVEDMRPSDSASEVVVRALVLEMVEGDTLEERIGRAGRGHATGLPLADTLTFARQIADALDAAHEKGIVHRDLKPANIKITPDAVVKVLDFGLARLAADDDAGNASVNDSPTVTVANTREGVIAGTAAYMSPEQARGQQTDKRTDIWAFGCVLYEMLTGRAAFTGATITDTLVAVLEREPDWSALPESTPVAVRALLRRCLAKNPKQRLRDIADARHDLEGVVKGSDPFTEMQPVPPSRDARRWALGAVAICVATSLVAYWALSQNASSTAAPTVTRTTIALPPSLELDMTGGAGPLAIAQDGHQIAYVAFGEGRTQLFIRRLDAFDARSIEGTDGAQYPFFSPDGEWVAFFADRKLKKVSIRGGAPLTVCDVPLLGKGGAWSPDGTIVFDPGDSGLLRVSAAGGRPEAVSSRDPAIDKGNLTWPAFLPDGRALLATLNETASAAAELVVLSLDTGEWHRLGPGSQPQYLPSGHVMYHAVGVREGELHAVAFDREALAFRGTPVAVMDNVLRAQNSGAAYFATAQNGTLIFTPGGYARTLVSVDRNGRRTPLSDDRRGFRHPDVSHDGTKVAVTVDPRPSQIWVYDLSRRSWTRLATDGHNLEPMWTHDDRRLIYSEDGDLFWRAADAGAPAERLLQRDRPQYATSWTPDGKMLIFDEVQPGTSNSYDIWALPIGAEPQPLIVTASNEAEGRVSPDGAWLAYDSDESGRKEVYVRPFPHVNERKWTISTGGGRHPVWGPGGSELFYALGSSLYRVSVDTRGGSFTAGTPEMLFSGPFDLLSTDFTITPDGTRFIMIETDPHARPTQIQVVLNWAEEVKRANTRETHNE